MSRGSAERAPRAWPRRACEALEGAPLRLQGEPTPLGRRVAALGRPRRPLGGNGCALFSGYTVFSLRIIFLAYDDYIPGR